MRFFSKERHRPSTTWRRTTNEAFELIDSGRLDEAGPLLLRAADLEPWLSDSWFNLALLHKFRRDWEQARAAGLRAVALLGRDRGAPDWWNLGICATALQDWPLARRAWQAYGLKVASGDGPVDHPLGSTPVRLSPQGESEVVWGRRLDPARVEVLSIPLPSSGRRWGEVVLHDGVPNGERVTDGIGYPVFDEIELWAPSPVPTFVVVLQAATPEDRDELEEAVAAAGYAAEDWTSSVRLLCRDCSESRIQTDDGVIEPQDPHDHGHLGPSAGRAPAGAWLVEREYGVAAPQALVAQLLDEWVAASPDTRDYRDLEEVC
ncbi:tetratricopeptide repeat protein [Allostreptomyces psammosilenae]|uniref:tetratricopeptide repeat protein n=1 Tax=Allostreptomyces psammosilenae TaxID=1892865 RepID=UPI0015CD805C|nr:tetratricopeptide repeat protein [Allostreptomyces psammosilenae]